MIARPWFFVSDLHGRAGRYRKLLDLVRSEKPRSLLLGGDLLPSAFAANTAGANTEDGFFGWLAGQFAQLEQDLGEQAPRILLILGNDDPRVAEEDLLRYERQGIWHYVHNKRHDVDGWQIHGYACVPPSPFQLKDWERYDVSRYVDPGCVSPEEGMRSVPVDLNEIRYGTIKQDLDTLAGGSALDRAIFLFHSPPYQTTLDRAALDGMLVDHAPLDVHVGSIAIRRFIEARQPRLTLHGHVHESARITGTWQDQIGQTHCFSAAHDGKELAVVAFDPARPEEASRRLI